MSSEKLIKLNTGQLMPRIGLGTSKCDDMREAIRAALDVGYRSIDTAYLYRNEEDIGAEIRDWIGQGKIDREQIFVTSKLPAIANRRQDVARFLQMSLNKLKLEYLDLYLIHHPFGLKHLDDNNVFSENANGDSEFDFDTDIEMLWKEMEAQVKAGKVKAIGLSNFNASQIERIMKVATISPAVNQIEVHAYFQQRPLVEKCKQFGIEVVAYSPFGSPYTKEGSVPPILMEHPKVVEIAKQYGKSSAQVLLKFLLQRGLVVIPKSSSPLRIKSNFEVSDFNLSDEDMKSLAGLDKGQGGRVFHFKDAFPGVKNHKEYPFHTDF